MMKKFLLLSFAFISCFLFIETPKAYVTIYTDNGFVTPKQDTELYLQNLNSSSLINGNQLTFSYNDPWFRSFDQYWVAGDVNGSYINVTADYYVAFEARYDYLKYTNYISNTSRNPLKAENLRCGFGYRTGYDSTYAPEISNFTASLSTGLYGVSETPVYQYVYHITYTYKQQINQKSLNGASMSCWFEVNPSNALIGQMTGTISNIYSVAEFAYRNRIFEWSVTADNTESLLSNMNDKLQQTILNTQEQLKEQQEANNKLDDLNNNITNSDVSDGISSGNSFFDSFDDEDYGFSDIIKIPLTTINKITSVTCSPLSLPLPFVETNVELPCMYSIYQRYFGDILTIYQTITFGMIAYYICIDLFRMVKNFKDPQNDEVGVMDL